MLIKFDQVSQKFKNGTLALDQVSFSLDEGEFVFLQGKSGAGKTTIARLLLKELEPTSGKIFVDDEDLSRLKRRHLPNLRRKIGVIFQDFKLLPDRTVYENIALVLDIINLDRNLIQERVKDLLHLVDLEDKQDLYPLQLSGGELQRVAIARALAPQPKLLFADEPTGNLDEDNAWQIIQLLEDINDQGTAVIIATHNQVIIKKLNKRILELEHGKLIRDTQIKHPKSKSKSTKKVHK